GCQRPSGTSLPDGRDSLCRACGRSFGRGQPARPRCRLSDDPEGGRHQGAGGEAQGDGGAEGMNLVALLLLAAAAAHGVSRWLRLPVLPLLIVSGMALNLAGFLPEGFLPGEGNDGARGGVMRILEFALVFLVFASGVELNPRRFARHGSTVVWAGSVQFAVSALIGWATSRWVGFGPMESAYIGFGLAASSTLVVLRQLRIRQAMFEPFGRVVTGVLLLQDAAMIAVIVVLFRLGGGPGGVALGVA